MHVAPRSCCKEMGKSEGICERKSMSQMGIFTLGTKLIETYLSSQVRCAHSLCISQLHIACACSDGIVRIFMTESLAYGTTLPRPAPLGFHDLTDANTALYFSMNNVNGITYPDAIACRFPTPAVLGSSKCF